jgi:hypothetical protein
MSPEDLLTQHITEIIDIARFAPSLYNTQPWRVHQNGDSLRISLDGRYQIVNADPVTRQTYMGLGIFCEAIRLSAQSFGLDQTSLTLDDGQAILVFAATMPLASAASDIAAIKSRSSDRSIYTPIDIPQETLNSLIACAAGLDVTIKITSDPSMISTVADFSSRGMAQVMDNQQYRNEYRRYLIPIWSSSKRGILVKSLGLSLMSELLLPWKLKKGLGITKEVDLERKRWQSASALIMIRTDGDVMKNWYEAGQAYFRVSLAIEKLGLSQATSEAIVEIAQYHTELENLLFTKQRILTVMRIGKGKPKVNRSPSPRVNASELID